MHLKDYHNIQCNLFTLVGSYITDQFEMAGFVNSITISTWSSSPTFLRSSSSVGKISATPPPVWDQKNVISRFSMAKTKWWCKCYWWLSWKETNLFMVVYSPLFQCSLQSCWTGIHFLGFINHSQKWPPHGSIYSAFCVRGKLQFGAFLTKNMI